MGESRAEEAIGEKSRRQNQPERSAAKGSRESGAALKQRIEEVLRHFGRDNRRRFVNVFRIFGYVDERHAGCQKQTRIWKEGEKVDGNFGSFSMLRERGGERLQRVVTGNIEAKPNGE